VTIGFELPDKTIRIISFDKLPLGIDFVKLASGKERQSMPGCKVKHVHGQAVGLGVQPEWRITSVNGTSVVGQDFLDVYTIMKKACADAFPTR